MLYTCLRWGASTRAHVHTRFSYLANGWANCVQTWCVASDPLDERLTQVRCGVHLHVRTCTPPSHDGASSPARPSPIKASYWYSRGWHRPKKGVPSRHRRRRRRCSARVTDCRYRRPGQEYTCFQLKSANRQNCFSTRAKLGNPICGWCGEIGLSTKLLGDIRFAVVIEQNFHIAWLE